MICRLTPKSCVMYAGLRLAKMFVCCCPDQLNKRLTDSKIESVRRKLCSVHAKSTFVVASSQSQRAACCAVYAIPQRLSFVVVLPYKNFCWLMYARHQLRIIMNIREASGLIKIIFLRIPDLLTLGFACRPLPPSLSLNHLVI